MPVSTTQDATLAGVTAQPTARQPSDRGIGSLKSEDFFKILVTELQQQDPLEPTKTADMISSVSQIRSIELSGKLTDSLDMIAKQQRASGTSEMIGKYVLAAAQGADGAMQTTEGVVTSVRFASDGTAVLELDSGLTVRAADVMQITTVEQAEKWKAEAELGGATALDPQTGKPKQALTKLQQNIERAFSKLFGIHPAQTARAI